MSPAQFRGGRSRISATFFRAGPNDLGRDVGVMVLTEAGFEGFFHAPIFTGVKGEDRNPASGIETRGKVTQESVESGELIVHGDAQGLENAAHRKFPVLFFP